MSFDFFADYCGIGFSDWNPNTPAGDINSMTQTVMYSTDLMSKQRFRMEHEFNRECISAMAK